MNAQHISMTLWQTRFDWAPCDLVPPPAIGVAARQWVSPVVESAFAGAELIPSWNATTPAGSWLLVQARLRSDLGWTSWLTFARWCDQPEAEGGAIARTTVTDQQSDAGQVEADAFRAYVDHPFSAWQARLTGFAATPHGPWPEVSLVTGAAVGLPVVEGAARTSTPGSEVGAELAVPPRSQRLHVGTFPEWDGGGRSWCSPTATTMVLEFWGVAPDADEVAWVRHPEGSGGPGVALEPGDAAVVHAVSRVFDQAYDGAGNWAFNVAYAATRGLRAYVTRLRDLREAEAFIAAGIPLVVSVSFTSDQLGGAGYDTEGHLLTIIGFTTEGDVVCNDPNSHGLASNDEVRVVYRRDQFEKVWLGDDGGLAYVMHPPEEPLPPSPAEANWG